MLIEVTNRF